jgi:hypothetical protein
MQKLVIIDKTMDLLIFKPNLAANLIKHYHPSFITIFKDLSEKVFFRLKATEELQKK